MKTNLQWKTLTLALCLAVAVVIAPGCKHKKAEIETAPPVQTTDTARGGDEQPALDLEIIFFGPSGLKPIYFDFDKSELRADAMETLKANAELMKKYPDTNFLIQIAGHCDERGTQEYNLALGERRALAVRDYLRSLGIPGDRLVTISYGEEFPADPGHDEAAWGKNRRAEFNKAQK